MKNFINWGLRIRKDLSRNYYSVWENLKTTRLDLGEEIKLPYERSEFYDVGITEKCNAMCNFCFTPGMKVITSSGEKNIEDISIGDEIISFNFQNNSKEIHPVNQLFERDYSGELVSIELENGKIIKMTPNHRVFVINKGWVEAKDLKETDKLYNSRKIRKIVKENFKGKVYNLGESINHNYFVEGILVHNCYVSADKTKQHYQGISETWKKWISTFPEDKKIDLEGDKIFKDILGKPDENTTYEELKFKLRVIWYLKNKLPIVYTEKPFQIAIGV